MSLHEQKIVSELAFWKCIGRMMGVPAVCVCLSVVRTALQTSLQGIKSRSLDCAIVCMCSTLRDRNRDAELPLVDKHGIAQHLTSCPYTDAPRRVALAAMALGAATDADEGVRNRGVRLVANKLYGNQDVPELTAQVQSHGPHPACLCA